ncbi:hypothetical protein [Sorangium sp. So ce341]|uniref:hypothetical protein n=1 Tax=Sorangium sp. So ce341 TaxID=3133302 RepID=UPI003F64684C
MRDHVEARFSRERFHERHDREPVLARPDGAALVDMAGADDLAVIVVNGLQEGDSRKPTLCIGTPDEVAACRAAAEGAGGGRRAGGEAPAGGAGGGVDDGGCGCRVVALGGSARSGAR